MTGKTATSDSVAADLKGHLKMVAALREGCISWGGEHAAYHSYEDLVLREGTTYTRLGSTKGHPMGVPKRCYANATRLVDGNPGRLTYVEGFAMSGEVGIAVEHAWAVDGAGSVVDTTWPDSDASPRVYVGLPVPDGIRTRLQLETGVHEVLTRQNAPELLAVEWPPPTSTRP